MKGKKGLPIGIQSFERLMQENFVYVDKTKHILSFIKEGHYYFLARPRRFGKTLLVSTLKEIFRGNRKLFKGLYIDKSEYSWEKHPVISINFATLAAPSSLILRKAIEETLQLIAKKHGVELPNTITLGSQLKQLILELGQKEKIVILIDEYDAPIIRHIENFKVAEECRNVLNEFYTALKDDEVDNLLRFVFITGISRFSKTSIFSGLNNLQDISFDPKAAALLGYTKEEIQSNYAPYLDKISRNLGMSQEDIMEKITYWYNGYLFTNRLQGGEEKVFNPYSVMLYLKNGIFDNYWFDTGTPTFLMKLLKKEGYPIQSIDGTVVHISETKSYDIKDIDLVSLLWQTGYLTIESYDPKTQSFRLSFPNEEVRKSFYEHVMKSLTTVKPSSLYGNIAQLSDALQNSNLQEFFDVMKTFFAKIPYDLHIPVERYYQSIFFIIMTLLDAHIIAEDRTNNGLIDSVIETDSHIYIFEFKLDGSAHSALEQIKEKQYYQKYLDSNKSIVLVGSNFDTDTKNITDWIEQDIE